MTLDGQHRTITCVAYPSFQSDNREVDGAIIDTNGINSIVMVMQLGTFDRGSGFFQIQDSDTGDFSGEQNSHEPGDDNVVGTTLFTPADSGTSKRFTLISYRRFIRVVRQQSGLPVGTEMTVIAVMRPRHMGVFLKDAICDLPPTPSPDPVELETHFMNIPDVGVGQPVDFMIMDDSSHVQPEGLSTEGVLKNIGNWTLGMKFHSVYNSPSRRSVVFCRGDDTMINFRGTQLFVTTASSSSQLGNPPGVGEFEAGDWLIITNDGSSFVGLNAWCINSSGLENITVSSQLMLEAAWDKLEPNVSDLIGFCGEGPDFVLTSQFPDTDLSTFFIVNRALNGAELSEIVAGQPLMYNSVSWKSAISGVYYPRDDNYELVYPEPGLLPVVGPVSTISPLPVGSPVFTEI